ncbi:hypothetical protein Tco_1263338 [Tanacetum coccineum]
MIMCGDRERTCIGLSEFVETIISTGDRGDYARTAGDRGLGVGKDGGIGVSETEDLWLGSKCVGVNTLYGCSGSGDEENYTGRWMIEGLLPRDERPPPGSYSMEDAELINENRARAAREVHVLYVSLAKNVYVALSFLIEAVEATSDSSAPVTHAGQSSPQTSPLTADDISRRAGRQVPRHLRACQFGSQLGSSIWSLAQQPQLVAQAEKSGGVVGEQEGRSYNNEKHSIEYDESLVPILLSCPRDKSESFALEKEIPLKEYLEAHAIRLAKKKGVKGKAILCGVGAKNSAPPPLLWSTQLAWRLTSVSRKTVTSEEAEEGWKCCVTKFGTFRVRSRCHSI